MLFSSHFTNGLFWKYQNKVFGEFTQMMKNLALVHLKILFPDDRALFCNFDFHTSWCALNRSICDPKGSQSALQSWTEKSICL